MVRVLARRAARQREPGRHGRARTDATDDVAFGKQLLVGDQGGATRHAELGRQGPRRRQSRRRRELAVHDSLAQALVDLLIDGATRIEGNEHLYRLEPNGISSRKISGSLRTIERALRSTSLEVLPWGRHLPIRLAPAGSSI